MAFLTPLSVWEQVKKIVLGDGLGPAESGGVSNDPHQNLTNRTEYLKDLETAHETDTEAHGAATGVTVDSIILRDAGGRIQAALPIADDDAAVKGGLGVATPSPDEHLPVAIAFVPSRLTTAHKAATYTRAGNQVVVMLAEHGHEVGHRVCFVPTSGAAAAGIFAITAKTANSFTFTHPTSGTTSGSVTMKYIVFQGTNVHSFVQQALTFDGGTGYYYYAYINIINPITVGSEYSVRDPVQQNYISFQNESCVMVRWFGADNILYPLFKEVVKWQDTSI